MEVRALKLLLSMMWYEVKQYHIGKWNLPSTTEMDELGYSPDKG